jgi:hypothetical protein
VLAGGDRVREKEAVGFFSCKTNKKGYKGRVLSLTKPDEMSMSKFVEIAKEEGAHEFAPVPFPLDQDSSKRPMALVVFGPDGAVMHEETFYVYRTSDFQACVVTPDE